MKGKVGGLLNKIFMGIFRSMLQWVFSVFSSLLDQIELILAVTGGSGVNGLNS